MKNYIFGALGFAALAVTGTAHAADLPVKARPMVVDPPYNWTGWYVGGNVGYSWGRSKTDVGFATFPGGVPIAAPAGSILGAKNNMDGAIAGGQFGYNWQNGNWVAGFEADIQWSGQDGRSNFLCAATGVGGPCLPGATFLPAGTTGANLSLDQSLEWFGTVRGRVGFLPSPTWMPYVTGGLAYGEVKTGATFTNTLAAAPPVVTTAATSNSQTKVGWTVGGGVEGRIAGNWTGKIEYLYMDLGKVSGSITSVPAGITAAYTSRITDNIVRVGVNYHFR